MNRERTFCRFCPALCGLVVTTEGDRVVDVQGDREDPLSRGYACEKGRSQGRWHHADHRLDRPLIRVRGELREASWDDVLADLGERLTRIVAESGGSAVGAYAATGAVFDASGTRLLQRWLTSIGSTSYYTSSTIDAPAKALISELLTGKHWLVPTMDYDRARLSIFIGSNPVISHGHFNGLANPVDLIRRLKANGEVWVIDPRRTETARLATRHLAPAPGTDFAVLAFLVRELLREGADRDYLDTHTYGVRELTDAVQPWDLRRAAETAGLAAANLDDLLAAVRRYGRVAGQTGTGVTMSAQANVAEWLLWCLHAVTGSFERAGGVWFNPGYLRQLDRREWTPNRLGPTAPTPMPSRPDLPRRHGENPSAAMPDEILAGNLRGLVVTGGNPMRAIPGPARTREALGALEVLAIADVREIEVMDLVTHVLPLTGQLERADTSHWIDQFLPVTAARYTPAVLPPGAERRPMWWVFAALAERMDRHLLPDGVSLDTATDDDLLRPLVQRGRGGSFESLKESRIEVAASAVGWVESRLLPEGRYRLWHPELGGQLARLERGGELLLIPRRQRRHLNSQLSEFQAGEGARDRPQLLVNPADATARGLSDGVPAVVRTRVGEVRAIVRLDPGIVAGAVSLPHGWQEVNVEELLTTEVADPLTGMPRMSGVPIDLFSP